MIDLVELQGELFGILQSYDGLNTVNVVSQRKMQLVVELNYTTIYTTFRGGKAGAGILVEMPTARCPSPNVTGAIFEFVFSIVTIENPTMNMNPTSGTTITAETLAQMVVDAIHLYAMDSIGTFRIDTVAIQPTNEFQGCLAYRVNFKLLCMNQQSGRVLHPAVGFSGGLATITTPTPGAAIYYTLDGSFPDKGTVSKSTTQLYSAPVEAPAGTILRAVAYAPGLINSAAFQGTYPTLGIGPAPGNPPQVILQPQSQTVTAGATVFFSITASGDQTLLFQWYFNGVAIAGATLTSLTLVGIQAANAGNYYCIVTNSLGNAQSNTAILTVNPVSSGGGGGGWQPSMVFSGVPSTLTVGTPELVSLTPTNWNLTDPGILFTWEASNQSGLIGYGQSSFMLNPSVGGAQWLECEVVFPDGRRLFLATTYNAAQNVSPQIENFVTPSAAKVWFPLDNSYKDAINNVLTLTPAGSPSFDNTSWIWSNRPLGYALRCNGPGDSAAVTLPAALFPPGLSTITLQMMLNITNYRQTSGQATMFALMAGGSTGISFHQDTNNSHGGTVIGVAVYTGPYSSTELLSTANAQNPAIVPVNAWYDMKFVISASGYQVFINGSQVASGGFSPGETLANWTNQNLALSFGQANGWFDEVVLQVS